jgi:hypothetical protein
MLVVRPNYLLDFEKSISDKGEKDIGKKERTTWLKVLYLLTNLVADKRPGLKFEKGGFNASELEKALKEKAGTLEVEPYGLSSKTLKKIIDECNDNFIS